MDTCNFPITWDSRHAATRNALAGVAVTTPLELFIYMGGDFDAHTPEDLDDAERDLRSHGYRKELVPVRFYGPLEERWVRHAHWPEDDQWPA